MIAAVAVLLATPDLCTGARPLLDVAKANIEAPAPRSARKLCDELRPIDREAWQAACTASTPAKRYEVSATGGIAAFYSEGKGRPVVTTGGLTVAIDFPQPGDPAEPPGAWPATLSALRQHLESTRTALLAERAKQIAGQAVALRLAVGAAANDSKREATCIRTLADLRSRRSKLERRRAHEFVRTLVACLDGAADEQRCRRLSQQARADESDHRPSPSEKDEIEKQEHEIEKQIEEETKACNGLGASLPEESQQGCDGVTARIDDVNATLPIIEAAEAAGRPGMPPRPADLREPPRHLALAATLGLEAFRPACASAACDPLDLQLRPSAQLRGEVTAAARDEPSLRIGAAAQAELVFGALGEATGTDHLGLSASLLGLAEEDGFLGPLGATVELGAAHAPYFRYEAPGASPWRASGTLKVHHALSAAVRLRFQVSIDRPFFGDGRPRDGSALLIELHSR